MSELERSGFFLVTRVSTHQQVEKYGLSWQREELPSYGQKWLGALLGDYNEGATSTSLPLAKRPVILGLLADLEDLRPGYLLVADQDRLARTDDFALIKSELRQAGVKLAYYRENGEPEIVDLEDEYGDFMSDIHAAVAKLEKRKIVKRMKRGKKQAAREGQAVLPVPYGYFKPEPGKVAIDPETGSTATMILEKLGDGVSIRKIVQGLNQSGVLSPGGKVDGWTVSFVAKLARNSSYVGRAQLMGETVPFPRLIDDETFERIPAMLERNRVFSTRNNTRFDYLCRSLARCERCGYGMSGTPRHGKPAYRCNGQQDKRTRGIECECTQPTVYATPIDDLVWQVVSEVALNPDIIRSHVQAMPTVIAAEATFLRRKLQRFDERRAKVLRQHEMAVVSDEELAGRIGEIEQERAGDAKRLKELDQAAPALDIDLSRLADAERLCRDLAPRLAEATFAEKRAIVELLVRRVLIDGKEITVELIAPLAAFALSGPDQHHQDVRESRSA